MGSPERRLTARFLGRNSQWLELHLEIAGIAQRVCCPEKEGWLAQAANLVRGEQLPRGREGTTDQKCSAKKVSGVHPPRETARQRHRLQPFSRLMERGLGLDAWRKLTIRVRTRLRHRWQPRRARQR